MDIAVCVMFQPRVLLVLGGLALACARSQPLKPLSTVEADLPSSRKYVRQQCDGLWQKYEPLISASLAPYQAITLSVDTILNLKGWTPTPQVLVVNNTVMTLGEPSLNVAAGLIPSLARLTKLVNLPSLVIAGNIMDLPEDDIHRQGGPWFGFCNHAFQTTNLLYPSGPPVTEVLSCGTRCTAFGLQDKRESKAIFLGSSTGWLRGQRRAAVVAGMKHSDKIYSGFTQVIDVDQHTLDAQEAVLNVTKPHLSMVEQVMHYKYIIVADGHCATIRMRYLLASDSVVFWMVSDMIEWFYPMLQPYVHYVPIRFDARNDDVTANDILAKLQWAEEHSAQVAAINTEAKKFAELYLAERGSTCFSVQMFDEYSRLFPDAAKLNDLSSHVAFASLRTHK